MTYSIDDDVVPIETRGRKAGSQNSGTAMRRAVVAKGAELALSAPKSAAVVQVEYYGRSAALIECERRSHQLAHLADLIRDYRNRSQI